MARLGGPAVISMITVSLINGVCECTDKAGLPRGFEVHLMRGMKRLDDRWGGLVRKPSGMTHGVSFAFVQVSGVVKVCFCIYSGCSCRVKLKKKVYCYSWFKMQEMHASLTRAEASCWAVLHTYVEAQLKTTKKMDFWWVAKNLGDAGSQLRGKKKGVEVMYCVRQAHCTQKLVTNGNSSPSSWLTSAAMINV